MKHLLVIDHDPLTRNLISTLLEQRGYTCDQAASEAEAFSLLRTNNYALIMLDLMLPEENGFRVLEHLRETFPQQASHTIVMTNADPKFVSNLPQDGWCAVLVKPFSTSQFNRIIDLCIGGAHTAGTVHQQ